MRIVYPTTPAQMFHLLRKQVKNPVHKPLVVFTPKGLLRLHECVSTVEDLTGGSFAEIMADPQSPAKPKRLVFCAGRVYYDLIAERTKRKNDDLVIVRIEQLYPLNTEKIQDILKKYAGIEKFYWVQEEPKNMGAWTFIQPKLLSFVPHLEFIGRDVSASPAAGSQSLHKKELAQMMETLFK